MGTQQQDTAIPPSCSKRSRVRDQLLSGCDDVASTSKTEVRVARALSLRTLHWSVVTIMIGIDKYPFVIHRERLCHYSSYFQARLTGMEAAKQVMEIPYDDKEVFEKVEHWLYTQKLQRADAEDGDLTLSKMIRVYVFASQFGMPLLQDAVVDAVVAVESNNAGLATPEDVQYLCKNIPSGSSLERLLAAVYAFTVEPEWLQSCANDLPKSFIAQIATLNTARLPARLPGELAPFEKDICRYHEHDKTTDTCSEKHNRSTKRKREGLD